MSITEIPQTNPTTKLCPSESSEENDEVISSFSDEKAKLIMDCSMIHLSSPPK
jgi:hypothetical protein